MRCLTLTEPLKRKIQPSGAFAVYILSVCTGSWMPERYSHQGCIGHDAGVHAWAVYHTCDAQLGLAPCWVMLEFKNANSSHILCIEAS